MKICLNLYVLYNLLSFRKKNVKSLYKSYESQNVMVYRNDYEIWIACVAQEIKSNYITIIKNQWLRNHYKYAFNTSKKTLNFNNTKFYPLISCLEKAKFNNRPSFEFYLAFYMIIGWLKDSLILSFMTFLLNCWLLIEKQALIDDLYDIYMFMIELILYFFAMKSFYRNTINGMYLNLKLMARKIFDVLIFLVSSLRYHVFEISKIMFTTICDSVVIMVQL
ncbi:hypothetical protein GVAV_000013 [Gurleya vavrai]